MSKTIREIAQSLIGRELLEDDGIDKDRIKDTESRLGIKIPAALKDFYMLLGNIESFISAFEYFVNVEELEIIDGKLLFLEENQGVCYWAMNVEHEEDNMVYVCTDLEQEQLEWYPETSVNEFLKVIMYLQCAEGGYEHGAAVYETNFVNRDAFEQFLEETTKEWEKAVEHNGFIAYQKNDKLIWYFLDSDGKMGDIIYASVRTNEGLHELEKLGFGEL